MAPAATSGRSGVNSSELSGLTTVALAEQARHVGPAEATAEDQRASPG